MVFDAVVQSHGRELDKVLQPQFLEIKSWRTNQLPIPILAVRVGGALFCSGSSLLSPGFSFSEIWPLQRLSVLC
ncbi:protein of unknown function [Candidatus Filomicrobium marinum]|uniref:Uncharacterized protein n=1 Tax=Candidatus Filomicrobium marinum TaxID=1608628 RepID=A0A0D6JFN6_9HYPH|nr:protein of unknown function [Candidatus Filomicrobium marinum]